MDVNTARAAPGTEGTHLQQLSLLEVGQERGSIAVWWESSLLRKGRRAISTASSSCEGRFLSALSRHQCPFMSQRWNGKLRCRSCRGCICPVLRSWYCSRPWYFKMLRSPTATPKRLAKRHRPILIHTIPLSTHKSPSPGPHPTRRTVASRSRPSPSRSFHPLSSAPYFQSHRLCPEATHSSSVSPSSAREPSTRDVPERSWRRRCAGGVASLDRQTGVEVACRSPQANALLVYAGG